MQENQPLMERRQIVSNLKLQKSKKYLIKLPNFNLTYRSFASEMKVVKPKCSDRFKKNQNLVEANKTLFRGIVTSGSPFRLANKQKEHKNPLSMKRYFNPRSQDEFVRSGSGSGEEEIKNQLNSGSLENVLLKNKMKKPRSLLSYNILSLERKYNFSRFDLHNLYSVYHTLLKDSKDSIVRFKRGFQVVFNMNKVAIPPQALQKLFKEQKMMNYQQFLSMYSRMDEAIYQQNILDYVEILFEGIYEKTKIRYDQIVRIMRNRITQKQSIDITKLIYQSLDRYQEQTIDLTEIYDLLQSSEVFAKKMYRLYTKECGIQ